MAWARGATGPGARAVVDGAEAVRGVGTADAAAAVVARVVESMRVGAGECRVVECRPAGVRRRGVPTTAARDRSSVLLNWGHGNLW
ncbi:hypothetical protein A5637_10900 [Mycolicibacterium fortuitum]|nr:hypothetical protein A5637_10900 [Mycolicibacterium fortuitum]